MRFLIVLIYLFSINLYAKDRVECRSISASGMNTPKSIKRIQESLNNEVKDPEVIKSISTSNDNGDVIVCIVVEGE